MACIFWRQLFAFETFFPACHACLWHAAAHWLKHSWFGRSARSETATGPLLEVRSGHMQNGPIQNHIHVCIYVSIYLSTYLLLFLPMSTHTHVCVICMYMWFSYFFLCMGEGMSYTAETCNVMHCISFCIDLSVLPYRMTRTCILVVQCSSEQGNII